MATILVVDDHAVNRDLIATLLKYQGHSTLEAADGAEGLALAHSQRPDLIISDILMPTMDGYELVRRLRSDPELAKTKVIFHTAHYHELEARNLAKACGVSHVLLKPSEPDDILRAIEAALAVEPHAAASPVEHDFDREHLRLVTDKLSKNAAQLRAANQRLAALTDVNLQLASEKNPRVLLNSVCRNARDLVAAAFAVLCVREGNEGPAVYFTTCGIDAAIVEKLVMPQIDAGMFGPLLAESLPRRYVNSAGSPVAVGLPAGLPAVHSAVAAPIASLTVVYGWICLLNKLGGDEFSEDDEKILASLASQVGRIYETGNLYAQLQRHAEQLRVEIAERKRSSEQLRESELRFRQLAENIHKVFYLVDPASGETLYVSPAYEEIWGRSVASVYANTRSWADSIVPEDRARTLAARYGADGRNGFDMEFRIARPDGGVRWIRSHGFPIRDEQGRVYRIAGFAEDITERVHLERVLREGAAQSRLADVIARLAHIITRPDGSFQSWSDTLPQLIGRDPAAVPASARAWLEIVHPDDRDRLRAAALEAGATNSRTQIDYRLVRPDGRSMHVRQVFDPIGASGNEEGRSRWFNTLQDVTDEKEAEQVLRESERRFSDMLGNVQLVSLMLDREGKIIYCNDFLLELTGWERQDVQGGDWLELFLDPDDRVLPGLYDSLLADETSARHNENNIVTRSGERRMIRWSNSVLRSPSGEVIGTASIGEDITERRRAETEVARLNTNLERIVAERTAALEIANRELETFSYSVSHDLRAPLHAIRGYAEALKESSSAELGETDRHYLERIASGSASMDHLIDDLLSLSRISRTELIATNVDLSALATEILSDLRAADPSRRSVISVSPGMRVNGDAGLLRIAMTNLLGNAWKFSGGREVIEIEVGSLRNGGATKTFFVRDHGAGFDPAYAQKLFGTFQRLHTQAEFAGTGIGLATVQRVIQRHGGTVRAEGAVNQGATLFFSLPEKAPRTLTP